MPVGRPSYGGGGRGPQSWLGPCPWGTLPEARTGVPPVRTGYPPQPEGTWDQILGYPEKGPGIRVLERDGEPDWSTPSPIDEQTENITLPHPSDAGGKNTATLNID